MRCGFHLLGSSGGYRTLAASADVTAEERTALEALVFGQSGDAAYLKSLAREPAAFMRPLASGRVAVTRLFAGVRDDVGRATLELRTILLDGPDYARLARADLERALSAEALWARPRFDDARSTELSPPPAAPPQALGRAELMLLDGWLRALDHGRATAILTDAPAARRTLFALLRALAPSDLVRCRWGVRLLSLASGAEMATVMPLADRGGREIVAVDLHGEPACEAIRFLARHPEAISTLPASEQLRGAPAADAGRQGAARGADRSSRSRSDQHSGGSLVDDGSTRALRRRRTIARAPVVIGGVGLLSLLVIGLVLMRFGGVGTRSHAPDPRGSTNSAMVQAPPSTTIAPAPAPTTTAAPEPMTTARAPAPEPTATSPTAPVPTAEPTPAPEPVTAPPSSPPPSSPPPSSPPPSVEPPADPSRPANDSRGGSSSPGDTTPPDTAPPDTTPPEVAPTPIDPVKALIDRLRDERAAAESAFRELESSQRELLAALRGPDERSEWSDPSTQWSKEHCAAVGAALERFDAVLNRQPLLWFEASLRPILAAPAPNPHRFRTAAEFTQALPGLAAALASLEFLGSEEGRNAFVTRQRAMDALNRANCTGTVLADARRRSDALAKVLRPSIRPDPGGRPSPEMVSGARKRLERTIETGLADYSGELDPSLVRSIRELAPLR